MIFPEFLDIQFSNLPVLIGGLTLGPLSGVIIVILRCLIKLPFTSTAGIGELADVLIGIAVVLGSGLYYKFNRTKKGGIIALLISSVFWVISAVLANYFIIMPFYLKAYGFEGVLGSIKKVIEGINEENFMAYYILYAVIPFNLLLSTLVNTITYFVYKKISVLAKEFYEK